MGKINKEFQWRMQGILHAREVVEKDGLEGLDKEIKMRGFMQAPLVYSKGQIDGWWDELSTNLYATMTTVAGMVLREHFGFGKQRLLKFRNEFQNMTKSALDLDYLGSHYVTLEDYANELNEQFDIPDSVNAGLLLVFLSKMEASFPLQKRNWKMGQIGSLHRTIKLVQKNISRLRQFQLRVLRPEARRIRYGICNI